MSSSIPFFCRYSSRVRLLKIALPLTAAVWIAGVVAINQYKSRTDSFFRLSTAQSGQLEQEASILQMVNPRFLGLDKNSRPFELRATSATQTNASIDNVQLEGIKATLYTDPTTQATIKSTNGHLDGKKNILDLRGLVEFADETGQTLLGNNFLIDTLTKQAISKMPIAATSRFGTIKATGLNVENGGKTILFEGPATVVLPESDTGQKSHKTP
jgi:hypothetical protein